MRHYWIVLFPLLFLLSACESEQEPELSNVFITFYPPAKAFELECIDYSDSEVCNFARGLAFDGGTQRSITLKSRKNGELATDGDGDFLKINATYSVSFYNSTQLDLYQGETPLFDFTIFNDLNNRHICIPIMPMKDWALISTLPPAHPENNEQALNYVENCRKLNLDIEQPLPEIETE